MNNPGSSIKILRIPGRRIEGAAEMTADKSSRVLPQISHVPLLVHAIPYEHYRNLERLSTLITWCLAAIWESLLTKEERKHWHRWSPGQAEMPSSFFLKLDALILYQAETLGWRLMLSPLVNLRLKAWHEQTDGADLVEEFQKGIARAARILERKELAPINDPGLHSFKREMTRELRILLRRFRRSRPLRSGPKELIEDFRDLVTRTDEFPLLRANLDSWLDFLSYTRAIALINAAVGKRSSPAALFDEQRAWGTGYGQETLRQKISRLGRNS